MFKDERDAAHQAVEAITNPTTVAIDALADKADAMVTTLANEVMAAEDEIAHQAARVAELAASLDATNAKLAATQTLADGLRAQLVKIPPFGLADFQSHPDWKANTGPSIGSTAPATFSNSCQSAPDGTPLCLKLSAQQAPGIYGDVLWSVVRKPVLPMGRVYYFGRFLTSEETLAAAQALEMDTKIVVDGYLYNFSMQPYNYAKGVFQVSGETPWKPVMSIPKPAPNVWHELVFEYDFDTDRKKYSFVALSMDAVRYEIPSAFHDMNAEPTTWSSQVHPQLQWSLNQAGKTATAYFDRLRYGQ